MKKFLKIGFASVSREFMLISTLTTFGFVVS